MSTKKIKYKGVTYVRADYKESGELSIQEHDKLSRAISSASMKAFREAIRFRKIADIAEEIGVSEDFSAEVEQASIAIKKVIIEQSKMLRAALPKVDKKAQEMFERRFEDTVEQTKGLGDKE